jgi:hypothetical protein
MVSNQATKCDGILAPRQRECKAELPSPVAEKLILDA